MQEASKEVKEEQSHGKKEKEEGKRANTQPLALASIIHPCMIQNLIERRA